LNILFRVDASKKIGLGHLMRCLALSEELKKKGYKLTTQRLAICKFILIRNDHPTAEVIYQELRKEYTTISLGTIYKTLHLLKSLGLIQELGFRYDSNFMDDDMPYMLKWRGKDTGLVEIPVVHSQ